MANGKDAGGCNRFQGRMVLGNGFPRVATDGGGRRTGCVGSQASGGRAQRSENRGRRAKKRIERRLTMSGVFGSDVLSGDSTCFSAGVSPTPIILHVLRRIGICPATAGFIGLPKPGQGLELAVAGLLVRFHHWISHRVLRPAPCLA